MRRSRIVFLMLAAVGGCTPLATNDDYPYTRRPLPPAQTAWQPRLNEERPTVQTAHADDPLFTYPLLKASAGAPAGTTSGTVTASKLPLVPLPASQTATRPTAEADQTASKLNSGGVTPVSYTESRPDTKSVVTPTPPEPGAPELLPPSLAGAPNVVIDLGPPPAPGAAPAFRLVNSKRFALNFEVRDVGATGVSAVELWCTQDTHTWKKFDSAQQLANALVVEVKEEGTYGFSLVARNGNGGGKAAPQPGDAPQVWVSVDMTKPEVELSGVELSLTAKAPSLVIRWTATDRNFGPRPVTLAYATAADGPWTLIAANVENTGRYEWPLPSTNLPPSTYIRVQAADLTGNIGTAQTDSPIKLEAFTAAAALPPEPVKASAPTPPAPLDLSRPNVNITAVIPSRP